MALARARNFRSIGDRVDARPARDRGRRVGRRRLPSTFALYGLGKAIKQMQDNDNILIFKPAPPAKQRVDIEVIGQDPMAAVLRRVPGAEKMLVEMERGSLQSLVRKANEQ
jgi:hypothetical protein